MNRDVIDSFSGDYFFLSNFYPCRVVYNGVNYKSSEHAYMASKFTDSIFKDLIINAVTPSQAKFLANKQLKSKIREDWDIVKLGIMEEIVMAKFVPVHMRDMLLDTANAELIEGNWWNDTFWGVCNGRGENHLGKILMSVRNHYRLEQF